MTNLSQPKKQLFFPFSNQIKTLFSCLSSEGDDLRLVGGSVRDFLANKNLQNADFDLACKHKPDTTLSILKKQNIKTFPSGIKYGTITAIVDGKHFQITTLRTDVKNFGRDCEVKFSTDFLEDAKRRDFTINALSIDKNGNIYDYFGGQDDLENRVVRFIGDARTRIKEDYLRILRFFRFSCFYAKEIDKKGLEACIKYKDNIQDLSSMRIREEFFKLFLCQNREDLFSTIKSMFDCGILRLIFNSVNSKKINALRNLFSLEKILNCHFEMVIFLAILIENNETNLDLSNLEKRYLKQITIPKFKIDFQISEKYLLKLLLETRKKELRDLHVIQLVLSDNFENLIDDFMQISKMIDSSQIPNFPINGNDLLDLKIEPNQIGKILKIAKNHWWVNDFSIDKKTIISFISQKIINKSV
ncbi:MAG: poly(A) polymerase [Rickettsiales bacterium]|jgi:poly(A) polymerase